MVGKARRRRRKRRSRLEGPSSKSGELRIPQNLLHSVGVGELGEWMAKCVDVGYNFAWGNQA